MSLSLLLFQAVAPLPAPPAAAPVEFGKVAWKRDFAAAEARAEETGKPLLVLFQEVPG